MPPSRPDEQSLLDRLNALKPTSVNLDKPADNAPLLDSAAQPVSKADALAARLRVLRNQGRPDGSPKNRSPTPGVPDDHGAGVPASPSATPTLKTRPVSPTATKSLTQRSGSYHFPGSEAEDEGALDELLESLANEPLDFTVDDEDTGAASDLDPGRDAKKISGLLDSLREESGSAVSKEGDTAPSGQDDDDDDSDGEVMTREVETILSQLGDEINSLPPPVPAAASHPLPTEDPEPGTSPEASLSLPTVPSQLVDPAPETSPEEDFERDISARLASLRGFGKLDALGLPSAPSFQPQDRAASGTTSLLRPSKYTDDDQKTWCVVCLDDATIRCIGCDNDVYCARCWKEMHVGPSAGYDERGHQWVKFERNSHA